MDLKTATALVQKKGPEILGPLVAQSARQSLDRPFKESDVPAEGIYYIVRYHDGWMPFTYRYDEYPSEIDHYHLWEEYISPILAQNWSRKLKRSAATLEAELRLGVYGFPRGRVAKSRGKTVLNVFNGADTQKIVPSATIERAFSIERRCRWIFDEHERCQRDDKEIIRVTLKLGPKEDWPTAA